MGLVIGNDNWWRTHGIGCTSLVVTGSGAGMGEEPEDTCLASYTLIETVHASLFMFLTVSISQPPLEMDLTVCISVVDGDVCSLSVPALFT